jgi:hypothetical protein
MGTTSVQQAGCAAPVKAAQKQLPWWLARPREAQYMALVHRSKADSLATVLEPKWQRI